MNINMKTRIGIIDYGMGNLHSVKNALDFIGCDAFISSDPAKLDSASGLILPGVGAFPDAMSFLNSSGMAGYILESAHKRPIMGICLGMQLLFDTGFEFRECAGLGLIHGNIVKIDHKNVKIPHIGWNQLTFKRNSRLTRNLKNDDQVYFVHSYKAIVQNAENLIAITDHGSPITAIVENDNIFGCQFHPEKSSDVGLKILKNFKEICDADITGN